MPPLLLTRIVRFLLFMMVITKSGFVFAQSSLPFSATALTGNEDLSVKMVAGLNQFLLDATEKAKRNRSQQWQMDFSSASAFNASIASQKTLLARSLGISDKRVHPKLDLISSDELTILSVKTATCTISAIRWTVLDGLTGEGILIKPIARIVGRIILIPDADTEPEALAGIGKSSAPGFGRAIALANAGFEIIIPALINRSTEASGNPSLGKSTQQPHREWIYRQGYAVGRHVIGYELQKLFAIIDWYDQQNRKEKNAIPIRVAGYGEGGLLALYAAALDPRISSTLVSGYFDTRENLWQEPIYRNVWGRLNTFGDAELAAMIWPRSLIIEAAEGVNLIQANPGSAPGKLVSPTIASAFAEFNRAKQLLPAGSARWEFVGSQGPRPTAFSQKALRAFCENDKLRVPETVSTSVASKVWVDANKRQVAQVREMESRIQYLVDTCERTREQDFWQAINGTANKSGQSLAEQRDRFWNVLGKLPAPDTAVNAKARLYQETDKWTSYEITLDVFSPSVFAWGILIVPKNIRPGEQRPVVVCQHGLEGLPSDAVTTDSMAANYHYYKGFATQLAERGYITFAPHNPYRGGDKFRSIQRKANPLGLTLFSVIISQHQQITRWLKELPFVDPKKIAFYGLSYGGKTAMRVPAVITDYALSICSADFNEWVRKVSTNNFDFGYVYTGEYDMPEWDLGHTFNYAEMAALIAPRPFMVERGHYDGVGTDEWVAYEFAKVKRYFDSIGADATIEFFTGPHTINGKGSFNFLDKHLKPGKKE